MRNGSYAVERSSCLAGWWMLATASMALCVSGGCAVMDAVEIQRMLDQQASAWNRGEVDGFMNFYWRSEKLTFSSGGKTRRGWDATREHLKSRYDTRAKMGVLTFSEIEVFRLQAAAAYVLGRWRLDRTEPVGGNFTLVVQKIDDRWQIVHDHTSVDDE